MGKMEVVIKTNDLPEVKEMLNKLQNENELLKELIESQARVMEGMTSDYEKLQEEYKQFKADVDKHYKYTHLSAKKSIEDKKKVVSLLDTADDELQYASTNGDDSNRDFYIKNAMRFIQESIELLK